ncbi:MAG: hypothetical protein GWO08_06055, partial [Gammaproteobacteria bacterium]|nr:hypothetical protein [Gammaproteobacteria bacterium]
MSLDIGSSSTAAEHEFFVSSVLIDNMVRGDTDSLVISETESFAAAFTDTDNTLKFSEQFDSLVADFNFFDDDSLTVSESQSISYDIAFWSDTDIAAIGELGENAIHFFDGDELSFLDAEWYDPEDIEPISIDDTNDDVIDEISIVFNESLRNPGFEITLRGLLDGVNTFS